jgi:hypothetical protein
MSIAPLRDERTLRDPSPPAVGVGPPLRAEASTPAGSADGPCPFAELVRGLGHEVRRGEALIQSALTGCGGVLGPAELIALQAGVYRYSEAVDLAAKLVDHATGGLKTIVQGQ